MCFRDGREQQRLRQVSEYTAQKGFGLLTDSKGNLGQNEEQLDPEGDTQNAVLAEVDSKTLVFSASKDGRDDIANTMKSISNKHNKAG